MFLKPAAEAADFAVKALRLLDIPSHEVVHKNESYRKVAQSIQFWGSLIQRLPQNCILCDVISHSSAFRHLKLGESALIDKKRRIYRRAPTKWLSGSHVGYDNNLVLRHSIAS